MAERSRGLPSQRQVTELLDGEFLRAGFDIEDVLIDASASPPKITVVADGDDGLDLDSVAQLARLASELLDGIDTSGGHETPDGATPAYVLEVTSPGVERPLTTEKHFRRARGRKVEMTLSDGSVLTGRLGQTQAGAVGLVRREGAHRGFTVHDIDLEKISKAVVQVEFSPPNPQELELSGQSGKEA